MAELKTKKNRGSVTKFLDGIADDGRRQDAKELLKIMRETTGEKPVLWGDSIVGFGEYHYESARSQQQGSWPLIGFSPRKQNLTIYIMPGFDAYEGWLKELGKHTSSKSCLYIKSLSDINLPILKKIIERGYKQMKKQYPAA